MISQKNMEYESENRICQNCKKDFVIESEDFNFYQKIKVPPPTFCPLCRAQRRMAWRNESNLFKRKSDFSGKEIFSAFSPESKVKVYEKDVWLSDMWEPMDYGINYDFSKSFFEQFNKLLQIVPLKNLNVIQGVNSDYCNNATNPRNSYLVFNTKDAEGCMYSNGSTSLKDCIDTSNCAKSEGCYESFWLISCTNTFFSSQCSNSYDIYFCRDCVNCHDCFGCVGLRGKGYYLFNKPYTKEEYNSKVEEFNISSYKNLQNVLKQTQEFWKKFPKKFIEGYQNVNVSGNYISNSKNVRDSSLIRDGENMRYCQYVQELPGSKDCYDYTAWGDSNELIYECTACGSGTNSIKFCYNVQENSHNIEYSYMCSGSSYLFGCIGLKKKQYCVFNKQYTKDEYFLLVERIKSQMNEVLYIDKKGRVYKYGEFFPVEFSPFAYNDTLAQEFFPKIKEEVEKEGFLWRDQVERNYVATLKAMDLSNDLEETKDKIISDIIECAHEGKCNDKCTKAFRIIEKELQFYRKNKIPLPRLCPKCRNAKRLKQRALLEIVYKKCDCNGLSSKNGIYKNTVLHFHGEKDCSDEFETSYTNKEDILYCEKCYQQEVY